MNSIDPKFKFLSICDDLVIKGKVLFAETTYEKALEYLYPLITRLDIQRNTLNTKLYSRLEDDIIEGCVMPPITVSLIHSVSDDEASDVKNIQNYIEDHISDAFILDGIQRLNALHRASTKDGYDPSRKIYLNFILAQSRDKFLYRMITLNNGQRPMSARHQIEILADLFYDFNSMDINLLAEKSNSKVRGPNSFKKADFVQGYSSFLSKNINIDNEKIIESKMDEILASKIIENKEVNIDFAEVVELVNKSDDDQFVASWLRVPNNFIGFCAAIGFSLEDILDNSIDDFFFQIKRFEECFLALNVSKIKVGKARKLSVYNFIKDYQMYKTYDNNDLILEMATWV